MPSHAYTYHSPPEAQCEERTARTGGGGTGHAGSGGHNGHNRPRDGGRDAASRRTTARVCLKYYSLAVGCLGMFVSFLWVCFQLYVLSQTSGDELRMSR